MEYRLSDIQIAALLLAEGIQFIRLDAFDAKRKEFVFRYEERISELERGFWQDTYKIAPRKYMGAFRELKNRLYA